VGIGHKYVVFVYITALVTVFQNLRGGYCSVLLCFPVVAFPCTKKYTLEQMKNIKETFNWLKTMTT